MTYLDVARQVLPITEKILLNEGALGWIALRNRTSLVARTTKLEWKEMTSGAIKVNPTVATISWFFDGTDKNFSIPTANIMVWDIISFQDSTFKAKWDLRIMITWITSWTVATARKIGGSDIAIATTDFAFVSSMAEAEGSVVSTRRAYEVPATLYNFTQIVRAWHSIPWTDTALFNYDFNNIKAELRTQAYEKFSRAFNGMITSSVRTSVTLWAGWVRRVAGWLNFFALNKFDASTGDVTGASTENVKTVSWLMTKENVNFAFKYVIENGWKLNAMVANTAQIMVLNSLYQEKINVNIVNWTVAWTVGGSVNVIKSPINIDGNEISAIYLDTSMPQDEVIFFNTNTIEAVPLEGRAALEEITEPSGKNDNYSVDLLWEWTVKVKNARANTYVLKALTLPTN